MGLGLRLRLRLSLRLRLRIRVCGPELPPTSLTMGTIHGACARRYAAALMVAPVWVRVSSCTWIAANCESTPRLG